MKETNFQLDMYKKNTHTYVKEYRAIIIEGQNNAQQSNPEDDALYLPAGSKRIEFS